MNDNNFKPFQQVLVRGNDTEEWVCGIYSHYDSVLKSHCVMGAFYNECIPYEGNEHLLGTTNEPKPKRWRAEKEEFYYFVNDALYADSEEDMYSNIDDYRYNIGNYFHSREEAEEMAEKFKEMLKGE